MANFFLDGSDHGWFFSRWVWSWLIFSRCVWPWLIFSRCVWSWLIFSRCVWSWLIFSRCVWSWLIFSRCVWSWLIFSRWVCNGWFFPYDSYRGLFISVLFWSLLFFVWMGPILVDALLDWAWNLDYSDHDCFLSAWFLIKTDLYLDDSDHGCFFVCMSLILTDKCLNGSDNGLFSLFNVGTSEKAANLF